MRVAVVSPFFSPAQQAGGPVQTLGAMVESSPESSAVDVFTSNSDLNAPGGLDVPTSRWIQQGRAHVYYTPEGFLPLIWGYCKLSQRRPDYLYLNSLFHVKYSTLPLVLKRLGFFPGARVLVAPRGELNAGALALKKGKKRIFIEAFKVSRFPGRITWHASTPLEADDIRREIDPTAKIIVRSNDTRLPTVAARRSRRPEGSCRLVFASRLVEKKRLHLLLEALSVVQSDFRLRVLGGFESIHYAKLCKQLASHKNLQGRVEFVGPVSREQVLSEFHNADVFAFPTAGENFGHVIWEALSASCPVVTTRHTPWSNYIECGGIVVDDETSAGFAHAIEQFIDLGWRGWNSASVRAADAYDRWRSQRAEPHLFTLLESEPDHDAPGDLKEV